MFLAVRALGYIKAITELRRKVFASSHGVIHGFTLCKRSKQTSTNDYSHPLDGLTQNTGTRIFHLCTRLGFAIHPEIKASSGSQPTAAEVARQPHKMYVKY